MKRGGKLEIVVNLSRQRSLQFLVGVGLLYLLLVSVEFPFVYRKGFGAMSEGGNIKGGGGGVLGDAVNRRVQLESQENLAAKEAPIQPLTLPLIIPPPPQAPKEENLASKEAPIRSLPMPLKMPPSLQAPTEQNLAAKEATPPPPQAPVQPPMKKRKKKTTQKKIPAISEHELVSISLFDDNSFNNSGDAGSFKFQKTAKAACKLGKRVWDQLRSGKVPVDSETSDSNVNGTKYCPRSIMVSGSEFSDAGRVMAIPCGLALGSNIVLVGKPRAAHPEKDPKIALVRRGETLMVSQFMLELQGSKAAEGEEPPKILHFNPRLKGDWSRKPVIELNTCYRMQWGSASRCDGWRSRDDEETVDGQVKCERWIRDDGDHSVDSIGTSWLNKLTGKKKEDFIWPYPFVEDKHFVLSLSAGLEGYHVNVDGRHITSFPYHTGFSLEDATVLFVNGDVDIHSVFAAALPTSHQSFDKQMHLEMSTKWQAPPLRNGSVELFVGILSAGHHFAERMAVRKSWLQHRLVKSSTVVARFFVALHGTMSINVELKAEAEFFGDIVIVPYMDNYDLVVLKTAAIFQYGVQKFAAKHIMKCDDDTFVRLDAILRDIKGVADGRSMYLGNINYHHKPLRRGKWSVTHEEWPEEDYPPYADGAGYVLSSDIARFVVSEFQKHSLRWFKMEDVSVGMWVEQFSRSGRVEYIHRLSFCQFGCIRNYYTAHYQSPRQMMCLWKKLQEGKPECCNMR